MLDNFNSQAKQTGSALLLAMLVMASVITVSMATSTLILNEVVQSAQLDKSIIAYYSAESGLEKTLFATRKQDIDVALLNNSIADLDNNSTYNVVTSNKEDIIYTSLLADESYSLDLYNQFDLNGLTQPIKALRFEWLGAGSWLEIKIMPWSTSGVLGNPQGYKKSVEESAAIIPLIDDSAYLYRLRIIARLADVANLQITAYNNADPITNCDPLAACQVAIPGRILIKSIGEYPKSSTQSSKQAIQATMPMKSPLSGLYDYVIYSEEDLLKEN